MTKRVRCTVCKKGKLRPVPESAAPLDAPRGKPLAGSVCDKCGAFHPDPMPRRANE